MKASNFISKIFTLIFIIGAVAYFYFQKIIGVWGVFLFSLEFILVYILSKHASNLKLKFALIIVTALLLPTIFVYMGFYLNSYNLCIVGGIFFFIVVALILVNAIVLLKNRKKRNV